MWEVVITLILFAIYVEISPTMGNIWYRTNSDGNKSFSIQGLINLMWYSMISTDMWRIEMWPINVIIWLLICIAIMSVNDYLSI